MRKSIIVLAVSLAALAGCAETGGAASEEITYWSMWKQGEDQQKVLQGVFDEFTAATGIKVKVQWSGRQVLTQVVPRLSAGNPPDLVDQDALTIKSALEAANGLRGLSDVYDSKVDGEEVTVGQVIPAGLVSRYRTKEGQPFLVPYEIVGSALWYNAKLDPQFKESPPATWTQFVSALDALKAKGRTPLALDGDIKDYQAMWLVWSLVRLGGPGTLEKAALDKTGAAFDDPLWTRAAQAVEQLISGRYFPADFLGTKFPTQQSAWAEQSSKTNILLMGSWAPSETSASLRQSGKDPSALIEYRSFPFPAFTPTDAGSGLVEALPIGFAIPSGAKRPAEAKRLLTFLLNKNRLVKIATEAKNLTPRTDIAPPPELADYATDYKNAKGYIPFGDGVSSTAPKWTTDVWQPAVADFFAGKTDAAGFIGGLKQKTISLYRNG